MARRLSFLMRAFAPSAARPCGRSSGLRLLAGSLATSGLALWLSAGALGCTQAVSEETPASAQATAESRLVEVFVTDWCPYCQRLEAFLKKNEIQYVRKNVEDDASAAREHAQLGGGGIPVTRIDGQQIVRGFRPDVIADLLGLEIP